MKFHAQIWVAVIMLAAVFWYAVITTLAEVFK